MSFTKVEKVDLEILSRISEIEIGEWMAARMLQIRNDEAPIHSMGIDVWFRDYTPNQFDFCWGMHAAGICAVSEGSSLDALIEINRQLNHDPAGQASAKRSEAKRLLEEAESLEKISEKICGLDVKSAPLPKGTLGILMHPKDPSKSVILKET